MTPQAILKRLSDLGISARVSGHKLRVEPGSKVPPELVPEIRQYKQEILDLLASPGDGEGPNNRLLAWAAQAAETGVVFQQPVQFLETPLRPYSTTKVGRYCREKLRFLALARSNRVTGGWGRFTPEWWREMKTKALDALSTLKAATEEAGLSPHRLDPNQVGELK